MNAAIVVGLSDSSHSRIALDWALRRAERTHHPVHVVYVLDTDASRGHPVIAAAHAAHAEMILARDAFGASAKAPDVDITTSIRHGRPVGALARQSRHAEMIVVGIHDDQQRSSSRHSPAVDLAALSVAPVAVIPGSRPGRHHGIVVGVDGSPAAAAALEIAARDADALGETLIVVNVWTALQAWIPGLIPDVSFYRALSAVSEELVATAVAPIRALFPDLHITAVSEEGVPADVLRRLGNDATEVVVGATARHGFARLLLGSVAHSTLAGARFPVIVVPDPAVRAGTRDDEEDALEPSLPYAEPVA
jgi:nucleotide-binding universal stress UspA family protein